jgi:hypothetical protein
MEDSCIYVSSRGLMKSCTIKNKIYASSDDHLEIEEFIKIKKNDTVYVNNSAIHNFFLTIFPKITEPFILVSGDSDILMYPNDYIDNPKIIHWFCQNLMMSHPKMTHMPIGLDYHTIANVNTMHPWGIGCNPIDQELILKNVNILPLEERLCYCYINFHLPYWGINTRGDRQECLENIDKNICYFQKDYLTRKSVWIQQSRFIFVVCPYGGGHDTHRLWESLILGNIPIIKSSGLDPLFENLNVCIVKSWSDINIKYLTNYLRSMKSCNNNKLYLSYWYNLINSYKVL